MEKLIQKDIDLTSVSLDKDFDHLLLELRQNPTQEDAELRKVLIKIWHLLSVFWYHKLNRVLIKVKLFY